MHIGCFALVDPFASLDHQLSRIAQMGFRYADITDNHPGPSLGREFGFAATVSLDANPLDVKRAFARHRLTITSVCAHANLLDPVSPSNYATHEIIQALKLAKLLGVPHVITTEGDPKTDWGHRLTFDQQLFAVTEKLYEPARLAADLGLTLLLEPHGILTDSIKGLSAILDKLGNGKHLGINLDTGNSWLGGADPVQMARTFKDRIHHVHWKDMPREWESKRGTLFGCGFGLIPLGQGVIDIKGVYKALRNSKILRHTTLEVAGEANLRASRAYLQQLGAD